MKKNLQLFTMFLALLVFQQCSTPSDKTTDASESTQASQQNVVLYGSNSCGHCIQFKAELDSVGIKYTFHDVEQNQELANEMLDVVHSIGYYDYILFPVVAAGDTVFIKPKLQEVLNVL